MRFPRYRARGFSVQHGARGPRLFRISNPTVAVLEERMAALEGGVGAMPASGPGRAAPGDRHAHGRGRPHRRLDRALRRLAQPPCLRSSASASTPPLSLRGTCRRGAQPSGLTRGFCLARRWEIRARRSEHSGGSRNRACGESAAAGRRCIYDPGAHEAVRARRRSAVPLGDQVPRAAGVAIAGCSSIPAASIGKPRANSTR